MSDKIKERMREIVDKKEEEESLPSKLDTYVPDLKTLIIALRSMDKDPKMFAYATTVRHTLMLAEAAAKAVETLETRITNLEKQIEAQAFMRP